MLPRVGFEMLDLHDYLEMPLEVPSCDASDSAVLRRVLYEHPLLLVDGEGEAFAAMLPISVFQRLCQSHAYVTLH